MFGWHHVCCLRRTFTIQMNCSLQTKGETKHRFYALNKFIPVFSFDSKCRDWNRDVFSHCERSTSPFFIIENTVANLAKVLISPNPLPLFLAFCKEKEKEKKLADDGASITVSQSAFLGPTLWDKTLPYDGDTFQLEYMDLEEFLSENGIPPSPAQHDHSPHQPAVQQATSATPSVVDLSSRASTSVHPTMVSQTCLQSPVRPGKSASLTSFSRVSCTSTSKEMTSSYWGGWDRAVWRRKGLSIGAHYPQPEGRMYSFPIAFLNTFSWK